MYRKILVPIDGSAASMHGLGEAVKLAKSQGGAELRVLHIVNEFVFDYTYSSGMYAQDVVEALRKEGRGVLDAARALAEREGMKVDCVLFEAIGGHASDFILEQAKKWGADLIVMGTHGRRGLARMLMGSDAEGVLRESVVPVLLVHAPPAADGVKSSSGVSAA